MKTVDTLWAVIALDKTGNEVGLAVYEDRKYGPMPLVGSDEGTLFPMVTLFNLQNPEELYRVKRFEAGALVELPTKRGQWT